MNIRLIYQFENFHVHLKGSTRQSGSVPSILASVASQDEQTEEKPVNFPRPDTSQMTPFKPTAGAGKKIKTVINYVLIKYIISPAKSVASATISRNFFLSVIKAPFSVIKPQKNNDSQPLLFLKDDDDVE